MLKNELEIMFDQHRAAGRAPLAIIRHDAAVKSAGKRPRREAWQQYDATAERAAIQDGDNLGWLCGLRCDDTTEFNGTDLDFNDARALTACLRSVEAFAGQPVRYGAPDRALVPLRMPFGTPSRDFKWYRVTDGKTIKMQMIAHGRQFVAAGTHPGTKQPYRWEGSNWSVTRWPVTALDELLAQISAAVAPLGFARVEHVDKNAPREQCELPSDMTDVERGMLQWWGRNQFATTLAGLRGKVAGQFRGTAAFAGCATVAPLVWAGLADEWELRRQLFEVQPEADIGRDADRGFEKGNPGAVAHLQSIRSGKPQDSASMPIVSTPEDEWPEPESITAKAPAVPVFKAEWLPPSVRREAIDTAHWLRVPLDYAGPARMVTLAAALGNRVMVRPNREDAKWLESASALWGMVIADPGRRKSPLLGAIVAPLKEMNDAAAVRNETAFKNWQAAVENHEDVIAGARAALRKEAQSSGKEANLDAVNAARKDEPRKPPEVHYVVQHTTSVYLATILRDNPHGVLNFHDELPPFIDELLEGQDAKARGLLLESWGGKGSFQYGSISQKGTVNVPTACMTLLGGAQPGPLTSLIHAATNGEKNANGLLQRFLCTVWPDHVRLPHPWIPRDETAATVVRDVTSKLATVAASAGGARFDGKHHYIDLNSDAQKMFRDWEDSFDASLEKETGAYASHLSKYKTLVAGWALLWTVVEWTRTGVNVWGMPIQPIPDIGPEAMTAAIEMAGYFAEHARRMYSMSVTDIVATRSLAAKLIAGEDLDGKTIRHIYRKRWPGLSTAADVSEAVENLRDAGWIRFGNVPSTTRGRPSVVITVSPKRDKFRMEEQPGTGILPT